MLKKILFLMTLCRVFSLDAVCNPYALPTYESGYVPFTIVNNGFSVSNNQVYVTITGTNPATGNDCFVQLTNSGGNWVGSLVDATLSLRSLNFGYKLSDIPVQNGQPVIYLPPIKNATLYLSIDYKMDLPTAAGSPVTIQSPSLFGTSDGNYYHLYDNSTFFSIGDDLNIQSQYGVAFGLPVSSIVSINRGSSVQYTGITNSRSTIFGNFVTAVNGITNLNSETEWASLPRAFTSAGTEGYVTLLRLASTLSAMSLSTDPFDPTYLANTMYGLNWSNSVFNSGQNFYLDVSALAISGQPYTTYEYMGISGGNLNFQPNGFGTNVTIPYPFTNSLPFLNAAASGPSSFNYAGDPKAGPLIATYLSAGFVTGLFPVTAPQSNPFGGNYLAYANVNGDLYQNNPNLLTGTGPWYDLYAATLHQSAISPYFNFQADAVDALLGFFSPIVVKNTNQTKPSAFIVLNSLGSSVVPNFADTTTYNFFVAPGPNVTVTFNGTAVTMSSPTLFSNVTVPATIQITYNSGQYNGQTYTSQIWVNNTYDYTVVFPQPPSVLAPSYNSGSSEWVIGVGPSP